MRPFRYEFEFLPCIVAFVGAPLTGKSTLAHALVADNLTNFSVFDVDETRRSLFEPAADYDLDRERIELSIAYPENENRARLHLLSGCPALVVATYSSDYDYSQLKALQSFVHNVPLFIFRLESSDEVIRLRLAQRVAEGSSSNIMTIEDYQRVRARFYLQPRVGDIVVPTDAGIHDTVVAVLHTISTLIRKEL